MASITEYVDIETLATVIFMLVDDWFKANHRVRVGRKAKFSESEVVTLMLLMFKTTFAPAVPIVAKYILLLAGLGLAPPPT